MESSSPIGPWIIAPNCWRRGTPWLTTRSDGRTRFPSGCHRAEADPLARASAPIHDRAAPRISAWTVRFVECDPDRSQSIGDVGVTSFHGRAPRCRLGDASRRGGRSRPRRHWRYRPHRRARSFLPRRRYPGGGDLGRAREARHGGAGIADGGCGGHPGVDASLAKVRVYPGAVLG